MKLRSRLRILARELGLSAQSNTILLPLTRHCKSIKSKLLELNFARMPFKLVISRHIIY